ncbi:MAG: hypothetical protein LIR46_13275, partial [Bacteroidota bacterium]|nr:hypothetical protein [Bacteroidota bacterium]
MKKVEEKIMTKCEFMSVMHPDVKIAYTYTGEPCVRASEYDAETVSVTLQAVEKETGISRAHGYKVNR